MPAKRDNEGESIQLKELVVERARRCLVTKSLSELTLDDVSRASSVPRSVLYRLFQSRDGLIQELVRASGRANFAIAARLTDAGDDDATTLGRLADVMLPALTSPSTFDTGRFNVEWWSWAARNETGLRTFREFWSDWRHGLSDLIRSDLPEECDDADAEALAGLMLAIYNGLLLHSTLEGKSWHLERIMRLQKYGIEGFLDGLRAE
jgi:AcrR family transcriptional regulator